MGLSVYNIKRWMKMLAGKSIYHVNQDLGQVINKGGYYNDLTQKVLLGDDNIDSNGIPFLIDSDGSKIQMPTMVFQYGLGAFDLWLIKNDEIYLNKAIICAEWAINHQEKSGAWANFSHIYPDNPYSAMSQGEGISLLLRIYSVNNDMKYYNCANKAAQYMITPVEYGGVMKKTDNNTVFLEYVHKPAVLNGWIFALFGLYDYMKANPLPLIEEIWKNSIQSLINVIPSYDNGYWSMYNSGGLISSPFYHRLHIAQMQALYNLTGSEEFGAYAIKWEKYQSRPINRMRAFAKKAIQKIKE